MNERITKLMIQAIGGVPCYDASVGLSLNQEEAEKFAELIVRECAKALDDKLANPNGASVAYCDGSDLLEHFGVEE